MILIDTLSHRTEEHMVQPVHNCTVQCSWLGVSLALVRRSAGFHTLECLLGFRVRDKPHGKHAHVHERHPAETGAEAQASLKQTAHRTHKAGAGAWDHRKHGKRCEAARPHKLLQVCSMHAKPTHHMRHHMVREQGMPHELSLRMLACDGHTS